MEQKSSSFYHPEIPFCLALKNRISRERTDLVACKYNCLVFFGYLMEKKFFSRFTNNSCNSNISNSNIMHLLCQRWNFYWTSSPLFFSRSFKIIKIPEILLHWQTCFVLSPIHNVKCIFLALNNSNILVFMIHERIFTSSSSKIILTATIIQ